MKESPATEHVLSSAVKAICILGVAAGRHNVHILDLCTASQS